MPDLPVVLDTVLDVPWAPTPNRVDVLPGLPSVSVETTAAHVVVLSPSGVLLTRVDSRGWDICGGHVEPGESATAAACREVLEEGGVHVAQEALAPLGHVLLTVLAPRPDGYRYPYPVSAQQVYLARLASSPVPAPLPGTECLEAEWVPVEEALRRRPGAAWTRLLLAATRVV